MVARHSNFGETRDFIPTPPFVTRAFYEYVCPEAKNKAPILSAWDPAAGHGHMTGVMNEYCHYNVIGTDICEYPARDVLRQNWLDITRRKADLILTNPPYALMEDFYFLGVQRATFGLGLLVRVQALEGAGRYRRIFAHHPPTQIAFFSDRIPFKTGVVVRKAPKMFFHVWLYWDLRGPVAPLPKPPIWIPPTVQAELEKDSDYV
jgi:hypothetical protein